MTSPGFGIPFHSGEDQSGRLGSATQSLSVAVSALLNCSRPSSGSPKSSESEAPNRSMSRTQPPGSTAGAGSQLTTKKLPFDQHSPTDRALLNSLDLQWRNGFGAAMIAISAACNKAFTVEDVALWAAAMSEHSLEDIQSGVSDWIKNSCSGFPTPGKVISFVKARRYRRLGIIVR